MNEDQQHAPRTRDGAALILHSLIWAAVMIAVALQLGGEPGAQGVQMTLLAGWFACFALLGGLLREGVDAECSWLRRTLRRLR